MKATKWIVTPAKAPAKAPLTEGLTPLDQDRASSLADEGGASAAAVEAQTPAVATPTPEEGNIDLDETPPLPRRPREKKVKKRVG